MRRPPVIRQLGRALAIVGLFVAVGIGSAAAFTYVALDGTTWTDPAPPVPTTSTPRPAATPEPAPTARPTPTAYAVGDCYTPQLTRVDCHQPGALQAIGVIHQPGGDPCAGLPETTTIRKAGAYTLCLTAAR